MRIDHLPSEETYKHWANSISEIKNCGVDVNKSLKKTQHLEERRKTNKS